MLKVGDKAPEFELMSDEGRTVRLKDFQGRTVVLYFYPRDNTPGCTREACAFRDHDDPLLKKCALLGVSLDSVRSHQGFKHKFRLPFPLLSDESAAMSKAYGVYRKKSMYGRTFWGLERTTFIIGPDGKIRAVFPRVKVDGHVQEVMRALSGGVR